MNDKKPHKGGNPSQKGLYAKVAAKSDKIFQVLFDLLDHKNENVRFAAAKTLANKLLPDLKAVDVDLQGKIEQIIITRQTDTPEYVDFDKVFAPLEKQNDKEENDR